MKKKKKNRRSQILLKIIIIIKNLALKAYSVRKVKANGKIYLGYECCITIDKVRYYKSWHSQKLSMEDKLKLAIEYRDTVKTNKKP